MNRYFNTSGPNNPEEHYTLMRRDLIKKGIALVEKKRYFTIWAPRQTGKSTYFRLLGIELEKMGYIFIHFNVENYLDATKASLVEEISSYFSGISGRIKKPTTFKTLGDFIKKIKKPKVVMVVDEIEGLNPELFGQFLHTIRNLYHFRSQHCLKSVVLVGVNNIVGVVEDHASPFNIADNVNIPYFTKEETFELFGQHEVETGQLLEETVKEKISDITANQPGLVNAFGKKLVEEYPDTKLINYSAYLDAEDWFVTEAIDKNIANIISKAKAHRPFVERLLFTQTNVPFIVDRPAIKVLHTQGIIKKDKNGLVSFWVPLYKKRLYNAFYPYTNGEGERMVKELWVSDFFDEKGHPNFDKIIKNYRDYVQKRSFRAFRTKDPKSKKWSIKEAALMYSFETYIQAFLQEAKGKSYIEAHTGLGRTDIIVNLKGEEYVIETKVYYSPSEFKDGKGQLAYYCEKIGVSTGLYIVFLPNTVNPRSVIKDDTEVIDGIIIKTYIVKYDEEKDF